MKLQNSGKLAGIAMLVALAACGGDKGAANDAVAAEAPAAQAGDAAAPVAGNVIEVLATTDEAGVNKFDPNVITARKGDVIRVKLGQGVHNFHINEGPAGATLPAPGQFLQIPGQTEDHVIDLPEGEYKFVCDPHAALGMTGVLKVEG